MAVGNPVTDLSTTGNFVPVTRTLTINGVSYDLSADRSWSIASPGGGSVTSVAMTVPTGFSVTGSPITSAGTLAVSFASGYALPTTVKQSNWDDAYTFVSNFPSQTGNNGKFLYTSGSVLSWQPALQNPMTAVGDMIYGGVSGAVTVLPGNQFTTRAYLQQVGTGSASAAPTWGGIISTDISGQALTRVNDTNVTLTLTGTPGNSVLNAVEITAGWSGTLTAARGGTGTGGVTGIMLGNSTAPVTGVTGIGGQILRANPSTGVYEFWTPTYLESPFNALGQIIYSGAGGQPIALNANGTANNMYLRSVSAGTPSWASIAGGDIVGAALTSSNDTNVQITLGGTPSNSVLRSVSLTMGWTGQLAVARGGTGVGTITGVVIGNGTANMSAVVGTSDQLFRRNATNTAYEFFTHNFLSNPMTTASDIIVANSAGAPIRLPANTTATNMFLRTVSGAIGYVTLQGTDIVGTAFTAVNDTNITITASVNDATALLRPMTLTAGWSGTLSVSRGGTGASTLTGVLIGNGASAFSAIVGTADQLLRRNAANTAYEFFTPNYLGNPMTTLGDIIYGNAAGAPLRLGANTTANNMYLRSVSSGAPGWASIAGGDITGAALTKTDDTNVTITLGGTPANSVLRSVSLTLGWSGTLSVSRGGSGAATLTGVLIGNGTSSFTGVTGTASQLLRRNTSNTAFEFWTPDFPTGSGTTNYVTKWTSASVIGNSQIIDNGTNVGIGVSPSYKLDVAGIIRSSGSNPSFIADSTVNYAAFVSNISGTRVWQFESVGNNFQLYHEASSSYAFNITGASGLVGVGITTPNSKLHTTGSLTVNDNIYLQRGSSSLYLPVMNFWNGTGSPLAGTKGDILAIGNTGGDAMVFVTNAVERVRIFSTGQVRFGTYTSTTSYTGLTIGYLGFDASGRITTNGIPGGVSGTQDYLAKFDSTGIAVGNSRIVDNGTNFLLNSASSYVTGLNLIGDIGMQSASGQASAIVQRSNQTPTSGTAISFLDSYAITTGSTYTLGGSIEFRASQNWNSTSAGTNIFVQTAPDNTTAAADMFVFLNNGAVRFIGRTSNPLSPSAGTMYYNSSANQMRYYNGTTWINF